MTFRPPIGSGRKSDAKIIPITLRDEEGTTRLYQLSERQTKALIGVAEYLSWINRHEFLPDDIANKDGLDAWHAETLDRLMNPIAICAEIINCIETDEDTQDALKNFIATYNNSFDDNPIGYPLDASRTSANLATDSNPTCDKDVLWAQCLFTVKTTNDIVTDLLEKLEGLTNPVEAFSAAAQAIPVAGTLIKALPDYIQLVQEFITENYAADYTTTPITGYEDRLACELFCVCKVDCEITIDRFYEILLNRVIARYNTTVPIISVINDLASYLIGIDVGGEQVADMAFLLVWGGLKLANFIVGGLTNRPYIGDGIVKAWLTLAANDPNSDWVTICTECEEEWAWIFPTDEPFTSWEFDSVGTGTATIVDNVVIGADTGGTPATIFIDMNISASGSITKIEVDYAWKNYGNGGAEEIRLYKDGTQVAVNNMDMSLEGTGTLEYSTPSTGTHLWRVLSGIFGVSPTHYLHITEIRFYGNGTNPFE